jgi:hypothetical protein
MLKVLIAAALFAATAAQAQGVLKPVDARIVNTPAQPVPVTVLSAPVQAGEGSREIYRNVLELPFSSSSNYVCSAAQSLPANKRLVVQHLSARAVFVVASSLLYVGMGSPGEPLDLLVPASPAVRSYDGFWNHSVAGQQVHAYFDTQYIVCVETVEAMNRAATVHVRGYLVAKP